MVMLKFPPEPAPFVDKPYPVGDLCQIEGCGHRWVAYGYCGFCYSVKIREAHEAAKNSTLVFG